MLEVMVNNTKVNYEVWNDGILISNYQFTDANAQKAEDFMRIMVDTSIKQGQNGKIYVNNINSFHLMYLTMGMKPNRDTTAYVKLKFGNEGQPALDALEACIEVEEIALINTSKLGILKRMLALELKREDSNTITHEEIFNNQQTLLKLKDKQVSYVGEDFLPDLLDGLQAHTTPNFPETSQLGQHRMVLSQEGIERWKDDLDKKKEFTPFNRLEHVTPYMQESKREELFVELDRILSARSSNSHRGRIFAISGQRPVADTNANNNALN